MSPARLPSAGTTALRAGIVCAILTLSAPAGAPRAESPPTQSERLARNWSRAGADLSVYLMTFGPGRRVWERFGHNALWIHDPSRGIDEAYNYGLFDFGQEHFLLRFIRGQMWYWMAGFPAAAYVDQYQRDNRSVWIQELELSLDAKQELLAFLRWNARPEHRFYHYDYYRDNCSTRIRDAVDRAIGGALRRQTEGVPAGTTYRFHTQRLTSNDPLINTGLLLALGQGVDRPISAWEEMFLPISMREHIRRVTVPGPDGHPVPLVRSERTIFESSAPPPPATPPHWLLWYLALGIAVGGAAVLLARPAAGRGTARTAFLALVGGWSALAGAGGLLLAGLWGFTDHVMAYRNENLFQVSPLSLLVLAGLVPLVRGRVGRSAELAALAVAGLSVLGLAVKLLPGMSQVNGPVIALAMPAHVGLLEAIRRLRAGDPPQRTRASPSRASR